MSQKANPCEHVMLLHVNDADHIEAAIGYINDALKKGQLAVYGSVHLDDESHTCRLSSRISDYEKNIDTGNLLVLNLRKFYEFALTGNFEPFEDLRAIIEEIVRERIGSGRNGEVVLIGDIAGNLSRNSEFDECMVEERWWDNTFHKWIDNGLKITIICMYASSILARNALSPVELELSKLHSLTLSAPTR